MTTTPQFGFTDDEAMYKAAIAYREAAVADGWTIKPTYGEHEPVERAATLTRDGWHMSILARTGEGKWKYTASVHIWAPDGVAIIPPDTYDFEQIKAAERTCMNCKATDVDTCRVGFAGRCCEKCLPEMRRVHEYAGWTS
jgi:hypothetical protein